MKHRLIVASSVLALAAGLVPGCGDHVADTDPPSPGAGGSANTPGGAAGGSQVGSGTGGTAPGGAAPGAGGTEAGPPVQAPGSAGTSGANLGGSQGGSGGAPGAAGAGGAPPAGDPSALCPSAPSPSDGVTCSVTCTDPCGIHNLGTRLCTCTASVFDCASCAYSVQSPLLTPPSTPLAACALADAAQEDATGCTENERCQSISAANRFCGCLMGDWDCDTKPSNFGG